MLQMKTTHLLDIIKTEKNLKLLFFCYSGKQEMREMEVSSEQKGAIKP